MLIVISSVISFLGVSSLWKVTPRIRRWVRVLVPTGESKLLS